MYEELVKQLKDRAERLDYDGWVDTAIVLEQAADAIEELLKAASAMHAWIFINSGDEQAAYDECGLSDDMNVALGYGGQFEAELPRDIKLKVMKRENELGIYDELPLVDQREMPKEET